MKNLTAPQRAVALVHEALDVLQRAGQAPDSPVNTFLTKEKRRKLRRDARRLREQKIEPRYKNLHNAEELAGIYERTVERDEILEQAQEDFQRITKDLLQIIKEKNPDVGKAMAMFGSEVARMAEEHGPGSDAALRLKFLHLLGWFGWQAHAYRRQPAAPLSWSVSPARDPSTQARLELSAAQLLDSPPSGDETVIAIPPEGSGSGRERMYLRIGVGAASWIGSFEIGHMSVDSVSMMPGGKHLFVSANGAGYIIDVKSRTLVEQVGTDIARVTIDAPGTLFLVDHNGMSLELFGTAGRMWKTDTISSGGFQGITLADRSIDGEARQGSEWVRFSVQLATGEVRFGEAV